MGGIKGPAATLDTSGGTLTLLQVAILGLRGRGGGERRKEGEEERKVGNVMKVEKRERG